MDEVLILDTIIDDIAVEDPKPAHNSNFKTLDKIESLKL